MAAEDPRIRQPGTGSADPDQPTAHDAVADGMVLGRTDPDAGPQLSDLLSELTTEVSTLFRQEVELAKAEVRIEAKRAGKAGGKLGAAAVIGLLAAFLLSWALAWLIALVTPEWVAFAIVGLVYAVIAGVIGMNGKKQLQQVDPTPRQTVETLKEDKEWVRNRR